MKSNQQINTLQNDQSEPQVIYIGSYSQSIARPSLYQLLPRHLTALKLSPELINPSFVFYNKVIPQNSKQEQKQLLYAVQQSQNGQIVTIDMKTIQIIQKKKTFGDDPCHISMNQRRNLLVATNYSSGSFIVYQLKDDGLIQQNTHMFAMHEGSSTNVVRQSSPHPHSSIFVQKEQQSDANINQVLFVADLGTDTVYYYTICQNYTQLKRHEEKSLKMVGCGPRHMARGSKNSKIIFICGQLDSTIRILNYSAGKLQVIAGYKVSNNMSNYPSQISYDPANQNVYLACRGDNYLIVFEYLQTVQQKGVLMQLKERFRFKVGEWPRHFNVSKGGTVYVACQFENVVQRFKIMNNQKIYQLGSLKISCPSCICFKN